MSNKKDTHIFYVYALWDPRSNQMRYVGLTHNPDQRLRQHNASGEAKYTTNIALSAWIHDLHLCDLQPHMKILKSGLSSSGAVWWERELIRRGFQKGWPLLNALDGGNGYIYGPLPKAMKARISQSKFGTKYGPQSQQHRDRIRISITLSWAKRKAAKK